MQWFVVPAVPVPFEFSLGSVAIVVALLAAWVPGWLAARHALRGRRADSKALPRRAFTETVQLPKRRAA